MLNQRLIVLAGGVAILAGSLMVTAGCSGKPSCKLLYKRYNKCMDKFPITKDAFMEMCDKKKDKPRIKEEIKCSKHSDCDKFKKCVKDASKKARLARLEERITEAVAKKKYSRALSTCKYSKKDLNDSLKKKCKEVAKGAYKELAAKAQKALDTGEVKNEYSLCSDLKAAGEAMGEADKKKAEALCADVKLARDGHKAILKAKESIKKGGTSIPFNCKWALDKLDKSKSAYAKKLKGKILKACYVDLGVMLLEKKLPGMKSYCPYGVKKLFKAVKKYSVKDAKLDPLMAKAAEVCDKK